jgi:UDP-glucuronate decarboxylase
VSNFIIQALLDEEITIYGDGNQTRSFCFVDDLIEGLIKMMNTPPETGGPVNLGMPEETTIRELAEMIIRMTGSRSRLTFLPLPQDDPVRRKPDITKASEILNWIPSTRLEEGLVKTIDYFTGHLNRKRRGRVNMVRIG